MNDNYDKEILEFLFKEVKGEFIRATNHYSSFNTEHEGYAILLEEMDELWGAIKLKQSNLDRNSLCYKEALQVMAMALRFMHDLLKRNKEKIK